MARLGVARKITDRRKTSAGGGPTRADFNAGWASAKTGKMVRSLVPGSVKRVPHGPKAS